MNEYINKQAAFVTLVFSDAMGDMTCGQMAKVLDVIKTVPTTDVAPVVHGRWIKNKNGTYSCSECHSWIPNEQRYYANFCLYCGARNDGSDDNGEEKE